MQHEADQPTRKKSHNVSARIASDVPECDDRDAYTTDGNASRTYKESAKEEAALSNEKVISRTARVDHERSPRCWRRFLASIKSYVVSTVINLAFIDL